MGYKQRGCFTDEHRKKISDALKRRGIVPPSRKGQYKNGTPFDRTAYMKEYNAMYYALNKEIHKQRAKNWWKHRDVTKTRSRNNAYQKKRMESDINFRITTGLRKRICMALKSSYGKKALKSTELLGCSVEEARRHLEQQFRDGMTWDNYASNWEIDHIKPLASFDLTDVEQQKQAFHYSNMQPLTLYENRIKGAR